MEAGAAELLAGEDAPCSADGSRTEPEPACGAEEAEDALRDAEEAALGTLLTLFAAGSVGHSHVVSSSCGVVVESPSSMPGAVDVLSGVFRPERFLSSSSRTVRTAQIPAAAAATKARENYAKMQYYEMFRDGKNVYTEHFQTEANETDPNLAPGTTKIK